MAQGLTWGHPRRWVPVQAPLDEVQEERVIAAFESRLERL